MSTIQKRRAVCSYENMSEELAAAFAEKYPKGYSDYFPDLVKYDKPDGTNFYAVTVEITDAIYLVRSRSRQMMQKISSVGLTERMVMITTLMMEKVFLMITSLSIPMVMMTDRTLNNPVSKINSLPKAALLLGGFFL